MAGFSTEQVQKAKEAIDVLSSILNPAPDDQVYTVRSVWYRCCSLATLLELLVRNLAPRGCSLKTESHQDRSLKTESHQDRSLKTESHQDRVLKVREFQHSPFHRIACIINCVGLMRAADRALSALKGMRRGLRDDTGRKKRIKSEISGVFSSSKRAKKSVEWKHRFVCLAWRDQSKVPTTDTEKDDLLEAGLGEKVITLPTGGSGDDLREALFNEYPKLRTAGGFQLCKCLPNSRNLEELSTISCSSVSMLKERVGNARTYILPLQKDLDMDIVFGLPDGVNRLLFVFKCFIILYAPLA